MVERTAHKVERNLWRIAGSYADLDVLAVYYGFDDETPGDPDDLSP